MSTIQILAGTQVEEAARQLLAAAKAPHEDVTADFNGATMRAGPGSKLGEVVYGWNESFQARADAWRASAEGQAAAAERETYRVGLQATADRLMAELPGLDWMDDVAVLDWLCGIQAASDHMGVRLDKGAIVAAFYAHGFTANANVGEHYRAEDRDNTFRYLIGQALDGLRRCSIHGVLHRFVDDWKAKFTTPSTVEQEDRTDG